jgi:phage recombination protein Bet
MTNEVTTQPEAAKRQSLVARFAEKYHIEPAKLMDTLKATAFRQRGDVVVTNEQMAALLIVADQYKLNPFTKEIFAFNDKGAVVPVVSVDGWSRIINEHPAFNGLEFNYSDNIVTMTSGKPCPEWCEVVIYRKDRDRPTIVREYLDEVYQSPRGERGIFGPWQTHTKRFLRHKTLIQGARIAFGFAGIYDEDEASRIVDAQVVQVVQASNAPAPAAPAVAAPGKSSRLSAIMGTTGVVDAPIIEAKAEPVPVGQADTDLPWQDEAGAA